MVARGGGGALAGNFLSGTLGNSFFGGVFGEEAKEPKIIESLKDPMKQEIKGVLWLPTGNINRTPHFYAYLML